MDAGRLARAGFTVHDVRLPGWAATFDPFSTIVLGELWRCHHALVDSPGLGSFVNLALHRGRAVTDEQLAGAMAARATWQAELAAVLHETPVLALPTLPAPPPKRDESRGFPDHNADVTVQPGGRCPLWPYRCRGPTCR